MSKRKETRNPDFIKGVDYPLQTYAWSGIQWGESASSAENGKRPTNTSPMLITSQPPGASAKNNTDWQLTFGASHDCVFTLFNGKFFNTTSLFKIPENLAGIYRDSIGTGDQNIYEDAQVGESGIQQIHYVVSKDTIQAARDALAYTSDSDVDEARGIGMRIPMMAGGWGRTIGMRPTDPEPSEDGDKRRNDEEHKLARETWKYGPVDLRWDDRRGVWGAWNDLIADHNDENLGTLVFDTNPDQSVGFPFFKGKLEDVWKIVVDKDDYENGKLNDTQKSGAVATHLDHTWAQKDGVSWFVSEMSRSFKIHERAGFGIPIAVGSENFFKSEIEILTTVWFHANDDDDGPILFAITDIEDEELQGSMKFNGVEWVPTVIFDVCDRIGDELGILFDNDNKINDELEALSDDVAAIDIAGSLEIVGGKAIIDYSPISTSVQSALETTANNVSASVSDALDNQRTSTEAAINEALATIAACLAECGCPCDITPVSIPATAIDQITSGTVSGGTVSGDVTGKVDVSIDNPAGGHGGVDLENPCP